MLEAGAMSALGNLFHEAQDAGMRTNATSLLQLLMHSLDKRNTDRHRADRCSTDGAD